MASLKDDDELKIFPDSTALFAAAVNHFYGYAMRLLKQQEFFRVILSGGKTPIKFFDLLAHDERCKKKIPWERVQFFFSDERYVPHNDPASNYHTAKQHLFSKLKIPDENIFAIPTNYKNPSDAAKAYQETLRNIFHLSEKQFPNFDLCYLGLGEDAHTASLMPNTDVVKSFINASSHDNYSLTTALWFEKEDRYRISLTPNVFNHAKRVVFLVEGENKATAVSMVIKGPQNPLQFPAQLIKNTNSNNFWYLDLAAAKDVVKKIENPTPPLTLGIDIGGTAIKMMIIDANTQPVTAYLLTLTPHPPTANAVLKIIMNMIQALTHPFDRVSIGFPGVVQNGNVITAPNMHPSWLGINLEDELEKITQHPARAANDADIQGFGDIEGKGVELVITLGTGMGSALFLDGKLVPNLELGHHPFIGEKTYEDILGKKALNDDGLDEWNKNLLQAIALLKQTFNYDHLYLGGGNSQQIKLQLPESVSISKNITGILGGIALWE